MLRNRSIPPCTVIPELAYADVGQAAAWLRDTFGFTIRLRIANHRAQLTLGDGAIVVTERRQQTPGGMVDTAHSMMVRVGDVDAHHRHVVARGGEVLAPPADYPYGERQYTVRDIGGHVWTFTQSIADVAPESWGGTLVAG